jgi:hypothetical protein
VCEEKQDSEEEARTDAETEEEEEARRRTWILLDTQVCCHGDMVG